MGIRLRIQCITDLQAGAYMETVRIVPEKDRHIQKVPLNFLRLVHIVEHRAFAHQTSVAHFTGMLNRVRIQLQRGSVHR